MPSHHSHETLQRHWHMLQLIPTSPAQITVKDLSNALAQVGFNVTGRTVQRDLNDLSQVMPLECNDRNKPYGWKWRRGQRNQIPAMTTVEALGLYLVQRHLANTLPINMIDVLQPLFTQASNTLENLGADNLLNHWLDAIVVEPPTQALIAPEVKQDVHQAVYRAVYEQKQLLAQYKAIGKESATEMTLHPLGIIQRGQITYLGATVNNYQDIRLFALHRFQSATIKALDASNPQSTQSWQEYLAMGAASFNPSLNGKVKLVAWIDQTLANYLLETPLSLDQSIIANDDQENTYTLTANIHQTWQLTWWILGQGEHIVIQEPADLRQKIAGTIKQLAQRY